MTPLTLRARPPQKAWRLMRILLVTLGLGLVGAFAGVAVPWLGTAADGARNCIFIIFANIQLVSFGVRVRRPSAWVMMPCVERPGSHDVR